MIDKTTVFLLAATMVVASGSAPAQERLRLPSPATAPTASPPLDSIVADPGFEAGTPNPVWSESSTNFSSPLCTAASCGTGTGTGPHEGSWWAWFGGISGVLEEATLTQRVSIPAGLSATLEFWFEAPVCSTEGFVEARINNVQVFSANEASGDCGVLGYTKKTVDVSSFLGADDVPLEIHGVTQPGTGVTNFFVDDVVITVVVGLQFFIGEALLPRRATPPSGPVSIPLFGSRS